MLSPASLAWAERGIELSWNHHCFTDRHHSLYNAESDALLVRTNELGSAHEDWEMTVTYGTHMQGQLTQQTACTMCTMKTLSQKQYRSITRAKHVVLDQRVVQRRCHGKVIICNWRGWSWLVALSSFHLLLGGPYALWRSCNRAEQSEHS